MKCEYCGVSTKETEVCPRCGAPLPERMWPSPNTNIDFNGVYSTTDATSFSTISEVMQTARDLCLPKGVVYEWIT